MSFNYKTANHQDLAADLSLNFAPYQVSADQFGIAVYACGAVPILAFNIHNFLDHLTFGIKKIRASNYHDFLKAAADEIRQLL